MRRKWQLEMLFFFFVKEIRSRILVIGPLF